MKLTEYNNDQNRHNIEDHHNFTVERTDDNSSILRIVYG